MRDDGPMRLFVAAVPPEQAIEDLAEHLAPRQEAGAGLRWTDTHQWHVTLAFLPSVRQATLEQLVPALAEATARREPLTLRLGGAGAFPNPYAARVLWTGVEQQGDGLTRLAHGIRGACNAAGAAPEGGRFHPHVTIARFGRPTEATRWIRALDPYAGPAWTAASVTLIESHLGEGRGRRPRYEVVAQLSLGE